MTVEYLWKAAGSPVTSSKASFTDVAANADYASAVAWAVENEITNGRTVATSPPPQPAPVDRSSPSCTALWADANPSPILILVNWGGVRFNQISFRL